MSNPTHDAGVIMALVERFNSQRLPRALDLKARVDAGGTLNDFDLHFLQEVLEDAQKIRPLVDRHPEYQELVARAAQLYREITGKALENEKNAG
jgi:hypothetical protein